MAKPVSPKPITTRRTSLKFLAEHLKLDPSTVSFVLNNVPGRSIPEATRERVRKAAAEFNYQPSMIARNLQGKPMRAIAVLLPVLGDGYHSQVLNGVGDRLMDAGYFYFTVHHRHKAELIKSYPALLQARGIDGILAIDTHLQEPLPFSTVLVAGHTELPEVTNIVLDHERGAKLALEHLYGLGHRKIVYMKGQSVSTDTELRWEATMKVARDLGLVVEERLIMQLAIDSTSPEISYPGIHDMIEMHTRFTAILAFNDVSAMGSVRALRDAGLRVPEDVSVVGFDDIQSASFHVPRLTTVRQPLQAMGRAGADALLSKLSGRTVPHIIQVEPELIVRESTAPRRGQKLAAKRGKRIAATASQ